jgi:hypothetical protein
LEWKFIEAKSLAEKLLFTTTMIECTGERESSSGTAFFFDVVLDEKSSAPFIVTNRHVIEGAEEGTFSFTTMKNEKPNVGNKFKLNIKPDFEKAWFTHPDNDVDIAVMPVAGIWRYITETEQKEIYKQPIRSSLIPTQKHLAETIDAIEEIIFIGYPAGILDEVNLLPIVRKGLTATPIQLDYQGKKQFLIDASVFPGSSGSPVFIYDMGPYTSKEGEIAARRRLFFLGVLSTLYSLEEEHEVHDINVQKKTVAVVRQPVDLGIVFKAETVLEACNAAIKTIRTGKVRKM